MFNTRIKTKVGVKKFIDLIKKYGEERIECTDHTFFHFSKKQRKIYNESLIKGILLKETPFLVGMQFNNNYSVFYHHNNKILKMIISFEIRKVNIVTFYFIKEWQIPRI